MRRIRVKVKPNSRTPGLEAQPDGTWLARIKAAPVAGKANEELIARIAERFGVPKSSVEIKSGAGARLKLVQFP